MIPEVERVTQPAYVAALDTRPIEQIRAMRHECQVVEHALSYARRLAQGRLDIVAAELARRSSGGDASLRDLISQLPDILADRGRAGGGPARPPQDLGLESLAGGLVDKLEAIPQAPELSDLSTQHDDALVAAREALAAHEAALSHERHAVHAVIDQLQAELTRRYRTGEASVDSLLH